MSLEVSIERSARRRFAVNGLWVKKIRSGPAAGQYYVVDEHHPVVGGPDPWMALSLEELDAASRQEA